MLYVGSKYPSNVTVGSKNAKAVFRGSTPQWAPPWQAGVRYTTGDIVQNNNGFYRCIADHNATSLEEPGIAGKTSWTYRWQTI